ncbi:MAG: class I SAM-dependent methyltransferase [Rhodospirillales bacterium]
MSRLDSFIRRLSAQRECLGLASRMIAAVPGPVLELGLGNGRTYDHLRRLLPDREIFVFERAVAAHPDCTPDGAHMILGELFETLPGAVARVGAKAALVHADIGSADRETDARLAEFLGRVLGGLMAQGGVIVSDQGLEPEGWAALPPPNGVEPERYFMYKRR